RATAARGQHDKADEGRDGDGDQTEARPSTPYRSRADRSHRLLAASVPGTLVTTGHDCQARRLAVASGPSATTATQRSPAQRSRRTGGSTRSAQRRLPGLGDRRRTVGKGLPGAREGVAALPWTS